MAFVKSWVGTCGTASPRSKSVRFRLAAVRRAAGALAAAWRGFWCKAVAFELTGNDRGGVKFHVRDVEAMVRHYDRS